MHAHTFPVGVICVLHVLFMWFLGYLMPLRLHWPCND